MLLQEISPIIYYTTKLLFLLDLLKWKRNGFNQLTVLAGQFSFGESHILFAFFMIRSEKLKWKCACAEGIFSKMCRWNQFFELLEHISSILVAKFASCTEPQIDKDGLKVFPLNFTNFNRIPINQNKKSLPFENFLVSQHQNEEKWLQTSSIKSLFTNNIRPPSNKCRFR